MAKNPGVRHWALLTVLLYGAACVVLTWPLLFTAFSWGTGRPEPHELLEIYERGIYWLIIDLLMLLQSLFLLLPIEVARERPLPRRRWVLVAAAAALMMGVLIGGLFCAVGEAIYQDADFLDLGPRFISSGPSGRLWALLALVAGWAAWTIIFVRYGWSKDPKGLCHLLVTRLLTGSVAELLVAVPCHVYVRGKEYCCAGAPTAIGLAAGLAVLLFAFGPGVFFLFVARARRLRGKVHQDPAAEEEDERKRGGPHTRDAAVWLAVSVGFLVLAGASGLLPSGYDDAVLRVVCAVAFLVLAGKAAIATWRAAQDDEPRWFSMVIALLTVLAAVLLALCWAW